MKAWILDPSNHSLTLSDVEAPRPRAGTVLVRMEAAPLLSYLRQYVEGTLGYWMPNRPFTPGTNGVGIVEAVGPDVYHLKAGQRVATNPYLIAHENVREPAQILTGLTGISPDAGEMLQDFGDGTLSELTLQAASTLTPLDGLEAISSEQLATLGKFVIPLGGLLRGRLAVGETLVVHGATGYFGSAAVLLGIALGAAKVVMVGRNKAALDALAEAAGPRAVAVAATGDAEEDAKAIRAAADGGADLAFDMVGQATSTDGTLATLRSLRRGGRLVLMGSMVPDLPISYREMLLNNWEIIGNFMYPASAYQKLVQLIAMGALSLDKVSIQRFQLADLDEAMTAAARMKGLDCTIVTMGGR